MMSLPAAKGVLILPHSFVMVGLAPGLSQTIKCSFWLISTLEVFPPLLAGLLLKFFGWTGP